ncbi:hypothetical protein BH20BAC1_BH20BAC1_21140 [soil metagenome]
MKGNEISVKQLNADAAGWLAKLHQTMLIKESKLTSNDSMEILAEFEKFVDEN